MGLFLLLTGLAAAWWLWSGGANRRRPGLPLAKRGADDAPTERDLRLRGSALKTYVQRLPDFRFTHCLVSRDYRAAVAVEENTGRLCLIDAATPPLYHRVYAAADLLEVSLTEDDRALADPRPDSTGYVLLGGVAFGWFGALLGYLCSTGNKRTAAPLAHSLELRLRVNDTRSPLWRIPFLLGPVRQDSQPYLKARETALQWQALLGVIRQRGLDTRAMPPQPAPPTGPSPGNPANGERLTVYQVRRGGKDIGAMPGPRIRALLQAGHLALGDRYFDPQLQDWLTLDLLPDPGG